MEPCFRGRRSSGGSCDSSSSAVSGVRCRSRAGSDDFWERPHLVKAAQSESDPSAPFTATSSIGKTFVRLLWNTFYRKPLRRNFFQRDSCASRGTPRNRTEFSLLLEPSAHWPKALP